MRIHLSLRAVALFAALAVPFAAQAADEEKAASGGAKPEGAWEVGARAEFFTVDPFLPTFYDRSESVTGTTFGGFLTRHSAGGNRIILGLDYTSTSPDDGVWLEAGGDAGTEEWTEFRDFKVIDLTVIIGKDWSFGPFGFFTGAGLGIAVPLGTITTFDVAGGAPVPGTGEKKSIPPAAPTVLFRVGPTVKLGPMFTLYVDAGFHNGLYAGAGVGVKF